ncbi:cation-translocating P-type ATPase [Methanocella arvoryzae]|uniref:Cation-transporting P-type ATPase n=1 Tax=Methanocella arvoryzae (strain DSM 22066 / NBRC 105507 / MRE50) TaxID=351160 RepID=Q0W835_METAR|nr:cation-translocating P-type ATPase [Methanocella arvoryzae]CAJ35458.1 cation-transporting P-type ATPase [Methanocella arvoryzae MRE50]
MDSVKITKWWAISGDEALKYLHIDVRRGLSAARVSDSRARHGVNAVELARPTAIISLLADSLRQPMILLLLSIAGLSLLFGKYLEAVVMAFVIIAYVVVEFLNKFRTDRVMAGLKRLTLPTTRVIREGKVTEVPAEDIVVGDLLVLSPGFSVPADARLLEAGGLLVDEASLTGESGPVLKDSDAILPDETPLPDRVNCLYAGTSILDGEGKAIVVSVGERTEMGRIGVALRTYEKGKTLLQEAMTRLAKVLTLLAILVSLLIPAVGFLRGLDLQQMVLTWLALTFLMIPGQPPIIIQMSLALASFRLAGRKIVVKRLQGAESMGSVTAILTDKTGTLTENRMTLRGIVPADGRERSPAEIPADIREAIAYSLPRYPRDPTDLALAEALTEPGGDRPMPAFSEGFSTGRQWRTFSYRKGGEYLYAISGSPEALIWRSRLSPGVKAHLLDIAEEQAREGRRVTAIASGSGTEKRPERLEGLRFVGLAVIEDPVRPGVRESIRTLEDAGIKTYILTGDHPGTAKAVAETAGIRGGLMAGAELSPQDERQLQNTLKDVRVYARITPAQKLAIVKAARDAGEEVAFVGDGVNDSPAIKAANVGIAMGGIGTDLAKDAADLVLTDDHYARLADAVRIGRTAIDNFRKGLTYYLSAKAVLLAIFLVPLAFGIPFPLAPIHIILVELLMDLASSTIFVTEPEEPDVIKRPPRKTTDFLRLSMAGEIARNGAGLAIGILAVYLWLYYTTGNVVMAQTAAFVTWLIGHILLALNLKQKELPLLKQGLMSNRFGVLWLAGMVVLSVTITSMSALHPVLKTSGLPAAAWIAIIAIAIISTCWIEAKKWIELLSAPASVS